MSSVLCFPSPAYHQPMKTTSKPHLLISQSRNQHKPSLHKRLVGGITCFSSNFQSPNVKKSLNIHHPSGQRGVYVVPLNSKINNSSGSEDDEADSGALETVLKLYSAIKNQNIREVSDIIDDECKCICNFFSCFHPLQGKKQVLEFFASLIKYLGDHVEFVVQPTLQDGMIVGIHWRLEWNKAHIMPLGKGFSLYTCHVYHGRVVIRNVEMFMEPLLHIEPFRLKLIGLLTTIIHKISCGISSRAWKKKALLALFFIIIIIPLTKLY
ncbi:hypothetical protein COLO4_31889 [Corchorus olitorius]|uniref:SnoaL-like domain-containing protein n=1 Tax=Corchorus olitorius TaxID=93759 RepID=A0A1R3H2Y9_9ROSI|nr:hypothetical protein COLO4_31889 [Corchorus olitorius]